MNTPIRTASSDTPSDAQIDALLSPEEDASIVDSLFAVSRGQAAAEAKDVLEQVLFARLQARIARRMRRSIEDPQATEASRTADDPKNARSAA